MSKYKVKIVGLPIKNHNATPLGMKIFNEVLEAEIIKNKRAKFDKSYIETILADYLRDKEILKLLAVEYKVNALSTYKLESQIQAQISKGYFEGREGVIRLIKNTKVGNAGLGTKYCTVEEAIEHKLTIDELDLEKIYNELQPFIVHTFWVINTETYVKAMVTQEEFDACRETLEICDEPKKEKITRKVRAKSKSSVTREEAKKAVNNPVLKKVCKEVVKKISSTENIDTSTGKLIIHDANDETAIHKKLNKLASSMLHLKGDENKTLDWD